MKLGGIIDASLVIVAAACLMAACCRQAVRVEGPPPAERNWCTTWSARTPEGSVEGDACVSTRDACERAVFRARRWGGMAGLSGISDCAWRGGSR